MTTKKLIVWSIVWFFLLLKSIGCWCLRLAFCPGNVFHLSYYVLGVFSLPSSCPLASLSPSFSRLLTSESISTSRDGSGWFPFPWLGRIAKDKPYSSNYLSVALPFSCICLLSEYWRIEYEFFGLSAHSEVQTWRKLLLVSWSNPNSTLLLKVHERAR